MNKARILLSAAVLLTAFVFIGSNVARAGAWSADLTFQVCDKTDCTSPKPDALSITIGEGTADTLLKPPPIPGAEVTGDPDDAIVDAYLQGGEARMAKSIKTAGSAGQVWAMNVDVEDGGSTVQLDVNLNDNLPDGYKVTVVDLKGAEGEKLRGSLTDSGVVDVFTSDSGGTKDRPILVSVGPNGSFGRLAANEQVCGRVVVANKENVGTVNVTITSPTVGGPISNIGDDGIFCTTLKASAGESVAITVEKPHFLKRIVKDLTVPSTGDLSVAIEDLSGGDANNDGNVNIDDFLLLRADFFNTGFDCIDNESTGVEGQCPDMNGDGTVNIDDFLMLRQSFFKSNDQ